MAFNSHASIILKSYPIPRPGSTAAVTALPPLRPETHLRSVTADPGFRAPFYQRMNALQEEVTQLKRPEGKSRLLPLYATLQRDSYMAPEDAAKGGMDPVDKLNWHHRSCQFTLSFQEPGGGYRMFSDTSLNAFKTQELRKAAEEEKKAAKYAARAERTRQLMEELEAKKMARTQERDSRRAKAAARSSAATDIQRVFRGRVARQQVRAYRQQRAQHAAYVIQQQFKDFQACSDAKTEAARRRQLKREQAASSITKAMRNYVGKLQVRDEVEARRKAQEDLRAELMAELQGMSAAKIQALYRGKACREQLTKENKRARTRSILGQQERRLQQKVDEELRRASVRSSRGSIAKSQRNSTVEIGAPFGLTGVPPARSPSVNASPRTQQPQRSSRSVTKS